jgi:hypothetical protein
VTYAVCHFANGNERLSKKILFCFLLLGTPSS